MRNFIVCLLFIISYWLLVATRSVEARVLPRFRSGGGGVAVSSGVGVYPRLRADRLGLTVGFSNLQKANSVTYTLIYQTNGKDEGVSGSIDSSGGNSATRELLFGTCSDVCRYHTGLSNMRFEVISELTSGKKTLKRFRIRI